MGLLFDDTIQNCNWPNQVTCSGCGGNTGPAPTPTVPAPTPTAPAPVSSTGGSATCGSGNRGNGICSGGLCCSHQWGYCGSGSAYCTPSPVSAPVTAPVSAPTGGGSGYTISSPSMTLSVTDIQAGVGEWNALEGGNVAVSQGIVNQINQITVNNNYNLFNQLAFVTHTIWESGAFQHKVEQTKVTGTIIKTVTGIRQAYNIQPMASCSMAADTFSCLGAPTTRPMDKQGW